jgi:hypothetical protein
MQHEQPRAEFVTDDSFAALIRLFMSPANPKWREPPPVGAIRSRQRTVGAASCASWRARTRWQLPCRGDDARSGRRWCRRSSTASPIGLGKCAAAWSAIQAAREVGDRARPAAAPDHDRRRDREREDSGHIPWTDEQVALGEAKARPDHGEGDHPHFEHRPAWIRRRPHGAGRTSRRSRASTASTSRQQQKTGPRAVGADHARAGAGDGRMAARPWTVPADARWRPVEAGRPGRTHWCLIATPTTTCGAGQGGGAGQADQRYGPRDARPARDRLCAAAAGGRDHSTDRRHGRDVGADGRALLPVLDPAGERDRRRPAPRAYN